MGQHRTNPNAIAKRAGAIKPDGRSREERSPIVRAPMDTPGIHPGEGLYTKLAPRQGMGRAERRDYIRRQILAPRRKVRIVGQIIASRESQRDERRARKDARWWKKPDAPVEAAA